jgi:predicted PurR-regulated permease PerM
LVTILAILTGFKLAGVVGAVLAVPAYLFVKIVYQDIIKPRQNI